MIFALILLACLGLSLLLNFAQFVSRFVTGTPVRGRSSGPKLEEALLKDNNAPDRIAVLDLDGIITSRSADSGRFHHGGRAQSAIGPRG